MLATAGWITAWIFAGLTVATWMAANRHLSLYRAEVAKYEETKKELARVRDNEREAMARLDESRQREYLRRITPPRPGTPGIPADSHGATEDTWLAEVERWANDNTSEQ